MSFKDQTEEIKTPQKKHKGIIEMFSDYMERNPSAKSNFSEANDCICCVT